ncbi:putative tRNA pseudouridine synthase Pus10, partial [Modicella reniformis]
MKHDTDTLESEPKRIKGDLDSSRIAGLKARLEKALQEGLDSTSQSTARINVLFSIPCCGRCILRFLGIRDYGVYELSSEEIKGCLTHFTTTTSPDCIATASETDLDLVCIACVGTVQHAEDFVDAIVAHVKKESYTTKTFNMNVTLPTSTLVRNHAIRIYWHQHLSSYPTDQVDIKEIFKLLISWPLEQQTGLTLDFSSELRLQVSIKHEETKNDHMFLSTMEDSGLVIKSKRENRKTITVGDGRQNIVKALTCVSDQRFAEIGKVPPATVATRAVLKSIEMMRESVYLGGRYLKYSRDVSQTPWAVGNTVLAELSVSGIVCKDLKESFRADDFKFVTAGREDANVRMLGNGRPFYVELINPRTSSLSYEALKQLEAKINSSMPDKVQIRNLVAITLEDTKIIKDGEESKTKCYSAFCWTSNPVDQAMIDAVNEFTNKSFYVEQQTPIRVLQRHMIRKKQIHSLKAFKLEGHFMVLHLHTEAGTYIKEFVHGDLGRNQPSLASIIGCEADIMELDVLEVDLEFPPSCLK